MTKQERARKRESAEAFREGLRPLTDALELFGYVKKVRARWDAELRMEQALFDSSSSNDSRRARARSVEPGPHRAEPLRSHRLYFFHA